jgi:hypothetical protein
MLPLTHPYWHVRELLEDYDNATSIELSYYEYVPQTVTDVRVTMTVSRVNFLDPKYIETLIQECPLNHEVAIHSRVTNAFGDVGHIPMVDMSTGARAHLTKIRPFLREADFDEFVWFFSGRSFHGYGTGIVSKEEWVRLMGALLLSNQKDLKPTVDPRWIGHRLLAGYSALRWTRNTDSYIGIPTRLK